MALTTLSGVLDAGVYVIGYFPTGVDVGADFTQIINKLNETITVSNVFEGLITTNATGIANNETDISTNAAGIVTNAEAITLITLTGTEHQSSGNFTIDTNNEPTIIADDSTMQNGILFDPAGFPEFPEGTRRIVICDNDEGITITSTAWLHEPPVSAGAGVPLRPGQKAILTVVGAMGSQKWEFHIDKGDNRPQYITLTADVTLDLRQGNMVVQGDGSHDVFLPEINDATVGHVVNITRDVSSFDIKPSGNDIFLSSITGSATPGAYDTYTLTATRIDSGSGGYKWLKSLNVDV